MNYHETRDAALPEQQRLNALTGKPHVIRRVEHGERAGWYYVEPFKSAPKNVFTPII
jgi:hypothetical protein